MGSIPSTGHTSKVPARADVEPTNVFNWPANADPTHPAWETSCIDASNGEDVMEPGEAYHQREVSVTDTVDNVPTKVTSRLEQFVYSGEVLDPIIYISAEGPLSLEKAREHAEQVLRLVELATTETATVRHISSGRHAPRPNAMDLIDEAFIDGSFQAMTSEQRAEWSASLPPLTDGERGAIRHAGSLTPQQLAAESGVSLESARIISGHLSGAR